MQCTNVGVGMSQQLSLKDTHTNTLRSIIQSTVRK